MYYQEVVSTTDGDCPESVQTPLETEKQFEGNTGFYSNTILWRLFLI